ncbi:MAG TPA: BTAD domain-containing putative transcriptional regulator, partial [Ilumatobacteraceae bacterium]|nr:BTAD domain-containing putative transcriptional regulator [Ilumatobacteraceae bacterium]
MALVRLLGPVDVLSDDGVERQSGSALRRTILALLSLHAGQVLSPDWLMEHVWGEHQPDSGVPALRFHLSKLRKEIGNAVPIVTRPGGYLVDVPRDLVDALRLDDAVRDTRLDEGQVGAARCLDALRLWRGQPFIDAAPCETLDHEATRLEEARMTIVEHYQRSRLASGAAAELLPELSQLVAEHPLREGLWSSLILAQYRTGQQAEALRTYERLRTNLAESLGLDPSPELRDLQLRVLSQDPELCLISRASSGAARARAGPESDNARSPFVGYGDPSTRVYTVMLTDVEGSVRLWERFPDDMGAVLSTHLRLAAESVTRDGGMPLQTIGDGMLAVFTSAAAAVRCAVEIQREVRSHDWGAVGELGVRIGLHTGVCRLSSNDALGRVPNLASRLQNAGHGGQVVFSRETAMAASLDPSSEIQMRQLGFFSIRGFDQPVEAYMAVADGLRSDLPPLRAAAEGAGALPNDDVVLVGRDEELERLAALLEDQNLVTLWGPAGVGKTRLAVRLSTVLRQRFPDGVRFVNLASAREPADVARATVDALSAQPIADEQLLETVVRTLQLANVLLVLDNCEPVLDGVRPLLTAVLRSCPNLRVLATSREPFDVHRECAVELRPLNLPGTSKASIDELTVTDSIKLFLAHAGFDLTEENAEAVQAICRSTDGLPLALELAGARASVEGLNAADSTSSGASAIDEALLRTLTMLSAQEARYFARLSVFHGPFSRGLAVGMSPEQASARTMLDRLVRTAVVQRLGEVGHYRLLEPTRRFAHSQLDDNERADAGWTHARMMLARAESMAPKMQTADEQHAVSAIRDEFDEHRTAFHWFFDNDAIVEAARLVRSLFQYCLAQPVPEGHRWAAVLAGRLVGDEPFATEIMGCAALGHWFAGDTSTAIAYAQRALAMPLSNGESDRWARTALVDAYGYSGDLDALIPHYLALVKNLRESREAYWQVNGLGFEAVGLSTSGMMAEAGRRANEAIAIARQTRNPECLHWGFYALGRVLAASDPRAACEAFEQAIRASRSISSNLYVGIALVEWVALKRQLGETDLAVSGVLDLLDMLAVSGNR